jgi:adenylate cyclase
MTISRERLGKALAVSSYMLGEARLATDADVVIGRLADILRDAGIPVDRMASIVQLLNAEAMASARFWEYGKGARHAAIAISSASDNEYERSPAAEAHITGEWVIFRPADTPDERFGIVPDLRADGFTLYICAPLMMATGMRATFSFATKASDGFSDEDIALLRLVYPAISACQEILATNRVLHEVTRMYVGDEPHRRILAGDVHRGEVMRLRSAIVFADMRDFTGLTADMSAEQATRLLNDYYDCVVPHIEARGGEVLKLIADGVLAIFRVEEDEPLACANAYAAALAGLKAVSERSALPVFAVGYGLHLGEVAYGNVGSGMRLDYTVIGRDVNFASRIATLCGDLAEPLLVSQAFQQYVPEALPRSRGKHQLKGISEAAEVFAPPLP